MLDSVHSVCIFGRLVKKFFFYEYQFMQSYSSQTSTNCNWMQNNIQEHQTTSTQISKPAQM